MHKKSWISIIAEGLVGVPDELDRCFNISPRLVEPLNVKPHVPRVHELSEHNRQCKLEIIDRMSVGLYGKAAGWWLAWVRVVRAEIDRTFGFDKLDSSIAEEYRRTRSNLCLHNLRPRWNIARIKIKDGTSWFYYTIPVFLCNTIPTVLLLSIEIRWELAEIFCEKLVRRADVQSLYYCHNLSLIPPPPFYNSSWLSTPSLSAQPPCSFIPACHMFTAFSFTNLSHLPRKRFSPLAVFTTHRPQNIV